MEKPENKGSDKNKYPLNKPVNSQKQEQLDNYLKAIQHLHALGRFKGFPALYDFPVNVSLLTVLRDLEVVVQHGKGDWEWVGETPSRAMAVLVRDEVADMDRRRKTGEYTPKFRKRTKAEMEAARQPTIVDINTGEPLGSKPKPAAPVAEPEQTPAHGITTEALQLATIILKYNIPADKVGEFYKDVKTIFS